MFLFILAYIGGVLTILSPCILPVLPFVFARADQPFLRRGLPLLLGMAATFAVIATLAAVGGGWAVQANEYGRYAAIALLALFGVTLLFPELSDRLTRPLVALGGRLSESADRNEHAGSVWPSLLLGVATGLLWAPCAGPVLGLILTGAALQGANVQTTLLLLAYAAGAATSLALALLVGGRVFAAMKRSLGAGEWIRRGLGAAVLVAVVAIALGLDTGFLTQISLANTASLEQSLVDRFHPAGGRVDAKPTSSVVMARRRDDERQSVDDDERQRSHDGDEWNPAGKEDAEPPSSVVRRRRRDDERQRSHDGDERDPGRQEGCGASVLGRDRRRRRDDERQRSYNGDERQSGGDDEGGAGRRGGGKSAGRGLAAPAFGRCGMAELAPLTAESLKGKVVLVDFWTYSCINCLRSIPYVRAWAEKYKDQGLVVIGVHAPEFPFEKNIDNVKKRRRQVEDRLSRRDRQRLCNLARVQ